MTGRRGALRFCTVTQCGCGAGGLGIMCLSCCSASGSLAICLHACAPSHQQSVSQQTMRTAHANTTPLTPLRVRAHPTPGHPPGCRRARSCALPLPYP